jgi:hypothetical protein
MRDNSCKFKLIYAQSINQLIEYIYNLTYARASLEELRLAAEQQQQLQTEYSQDGDSTGSVSVQASSFATHVYTPYQLGLRGSTMHWPFDSPSISALKEESTGLDDDDDEMESMPLLLIKNKGRDFDIENLFKLELSAPFNDHDAQAMIAAVEQCDRMWLTQEEKLANVETQLTETLALLRAREESGIN